MGEGTGAPEIRGPARRRKQPGLRAITPLVEGTKLIDSEGVRESRTPRSRSRMMVKAQGIRARTRGTHATKHLKDIPGTLSAFCLKLPGGKETFIDYARWSPDDGIKNLVRIWDALTTKERKSTNVDLLAREAGIDSSDAAGKVVSAAMRYNRHVSDVIASTFQPMVVEKTARQALTDEGIADRKMFLEMSGMLPTAKGAMFQQQINVQSGTGPDSPAFEDSIMTVAEAIREDGI